MDTSEVRPILHLAGPAVLSALASQGLMVVDTVMVADFGQTAIGGASLALLVCFATLWLARGIQRAMDPLVSQACGAGERDAAGRWLRRGILLGLLLAIPVVAVLLVAEPILRALDQPSTVIPLAGQYCRIFALGIPSILILGAIQQFLQSIGVMRPVTLSILVGNGLNVLLNLLFMYRLGWGTLGCAVSTVICEWAMLVLCLYLSRDVWREWRPVGQPVWAEEWSAVVRLFYLGLPLGLQQALEVWGFSIAGIMVGWQGETALAAHTLCLNLASVSFMMPMGIGIAAGTRVGNLLGAQKSWGVAAWTAVAMGLGVMTLSFTLFRYFPATVLSLYRPEPAVLAAGMALLPIAGAFQLFDGVQAVSFGVLRGAGDMKMPAMANVVGYYCIGLPLGWYLSHDRGAAGVWMGLTVALATVAALLVFRIRWTLARGGFRLE